MITPRGINAMAVDSIIGVLKHDTDQHIAIMAGSLDNALPPNPSCSIFQLANRSKLG